MDNTQQPLVSIIIRARNEENALRRQLPILLEQKTDFQYEIWLLDNESQDDTIHVAHSYSVKTHSIPRRQFNYAAALNTGAQLAQGQFVVNLSAHCFPQTDQWLVRLIEPLRRDPTVIGAYGRQWFDAKTSPYTAESNETLFPVNPGDRVCVAFSNANAAIRRDVLLRNPFNPHIKILEDHLFYLELATEGRFEYVTDALVNHEHNDFSPKYHFKRWLLEGWAFYFILKQRGYASPFKTQRFFDRNALKNYVNLARKLSYSGHKTAGRVAIPFFGSREIMWTVGWLVGRLRHNITARRDRDFLLESMGKSREVTCGAGYLVENHTGQDIRQWPEEWQLKADWAYIRRNIEEFIRRCNENGAIFQVPLLEIGASGQNDYLGDKYQLITSNLAHNRQGAALSLDMEDMSCFDDDSIGSILCSEVIEHVRHPERALAEAYRVLKPGGKLIITTPYAIIIHNTPDDGGFHGRNFTPQGLELHLVETGFKILTLETRGTTPTRQKLFPSNIFVIAEKP